MSKYKFKRKESPAKEPKIMNSSASPEENTAVFSKPQLPKNEAPKEEVTVLLEEDDDTALEDAVTAEEVSELLTADTDGSKEEIISTVDSIFRGRHMSVDEIKTNLTSNSERDLSALYDSSKPLKHKKKPSDYEDEEDIPVPKKAAIKSKAAPAAKEDEDDEYEGLEDTTASIEEDESAVPEDTKEAVCEDAAADKSADAKPAEKQNGDAIDIYSNSQMEGEKVLDVNKRPDKIKPRKEEIEYTRESDTEDLVDMYKKKSRISLFAFLAVLVSTLVLIYLETKAFPHPEWLMPGKFGVLYLLIDLQFVFISAVCVLNQLIDGAVSLFTWKPNKNSVTLAAFIAATVQIILHLILNKYSASISLYSSVFSLCAMATALVTYIDTHREFITFAVASLDEDKRIVTTLDETSDEYKKFSEYLPEDAILYKMSKTSFVKSFFKTNSRPSPYNEAYKVSIPLVFLVSVIFAILNVTLIKGNSVSAINTFALSFMMAMPISSIFTVALPYLITTLRLSMVQSAILGEASVDEIANTSLVSFADTDIFKSQGIKISSIKTYGQGRIDTIYLIASKVFALLGGPLEDVFNRSVIMTDSDRSGDRVVNVEENGAEVYVEDKQIFIGNCEYIHSKGFAHIDDSIDAAFTNQNGRIMYIVINGEVSAKFYIKYAIGKSFRILLDSFKNLGICMAISTRDPNLDTDFITHLLKDKDYPIVVVKNTFPPTEEETAASEEDESNIVSASTVQNMLRTFLAADRLASVISINTLSKYIGLIVAFVLVIVAFLADGSHEKITPLFIMLYQLVWSLPMIGTSFFG